MTDRTDKAVCAVFGVTMEQIISKRRTTQISRARQTCMYYHRQETKLSYPRVAKRYQRNDHTTALWACRRIEELRRKDWRFDEKLRKVEALKGSI